MRVHEHMHVGKCPHAHPSLRRGCREHGVHGHLVAGIRAAAGYAHVGVLATCIDKRWQSGGNAGVLGLSVRALDQVQSASWGKEEHQQNDLKCL